MIEPKKLLELVDDPMGIIDAIYKRRTIRNYAPDVVDEHTVHALLYAAIQAPTAMHEEPWAFAVIQDKKLLNQLSEDAKELVWEEAKGSDSHLAKHSIKMVSNPEFNIFYNATTLIVIYGKPMGSFVVADCWLAAQNLMLAACAAGLGSCVIGFAVSALNTPEWKKELGVPLEYTAYAPIIIGKPAGETPTSPRKPPDVIAWKKAA
jgi:nitroreductase